MGKRPTKQQFQNKLEHIAGTLRNEIVKGRYAPGDYLPTERSIMERFRMSNNAVRTALAALVREGWVEKVPRVGNRVAAGRPPVTLVLAGWHIAFHNHGLSRLLADFERQHPWITVEQRIWNGVEGNKERASGNDVDVILMDNLHFQLMLENKTVHNLERLSRRAGTYPVLANLFTHEGDQYAQPIVFSPVVLLYNKEHFRQAGLLEPDGSWTWDQLMYCAEALADGKGRYGFCFHAQDFNRWPIFLLQSGEKFERSGTQWNDLRGTNMLEGMKLYKRIVQNRKSFPHFLSESNNEMITLFSEGKLSMIMNSYMGLGSLIHSDLDYDVAPVPFLYEPRTLVTCLGIGVSAKSVHKEEAQLLIDYLASVEAGTHIYEHTLSIPCTQMPSYTTAGTINRPERYSLFREMMFSYRTHRDLGISSGALRRVLHPLKAYLADMIDEEELCDRIQEALSHEMQDNDNELSH